MICELMFLILPILTSGLAFIICLKINRTKFNYPLDLGFKWKRKRLFGENKTIKGPLCMGIFSVVFGYLTYLNLKDYLNLEISNSQIMLSFLFIGVIYSLGELPNSFIKRQLSIPPGGTHTNKVVKSAFKFIDTFDSLVFVGIAYKLLFNFQSTVIILAILIGGLIHLSTDRLMVKLALKQKFD